MTITRGGPTMGGDRWIEVKLRSPSSIRLRDLDLRATLKSELKLKQEVVDRIHGSNF